MVAKQTSGNEMGAKDCPYLVGGGVWFQKEGEIFFNEQTFLLLEKIKENGSILQAAQWLGISYSKAWGIIDKANHLSRMPLLVRKRGGTDGGGASLTKEGLRMLREYSTLHVSYTEFLKQQNIAYGYETD